MYFGPLLSFWQFLCRRGRHYAIFQIQFEDHWMEKLVTLEYSGLANMIKSESLCSISLKNLSICKIGVTDFNAKAGWGFNLL